MHIALTANHGAGSVRVLVAEGVYRPTPGRTSTWDNRSFKPGDGTELYGGFPKGGSSFADRDPKRYETILSGDINGDDASTGNVSDNSVHVVFVKEQSSCLLDGFTITAGQRTGLCVYIGGRCSIAETTFFNNKSKAIHSYYDTDLRVEHSGFFGSTDREQVIYCLGRTSISHCVFSGNKCANVVDANSGNFQGVRVSATGRLGCILGKVGSGVFDLQSGQFSRFMDATDACFLESSSSLVSGFDDRLCTVNLRTNSTTRRALQGARITCLSSSPDGNTIAVGTIERTIHFLDGQLADRGAPLTGHASRVTDVLFLRDNLLASVSSDGTVLIWDLERQVTTRAMTAVTADGAIADAVNDAWLGWGQHVTLASNADHTQILTSRGNEVTLLDLEAGASRVLAGHSNYVYFATHSPDGTLIASYAYDHKLILWDAFTGERLATMPCDEASNLPTGLAFTRDGSFVIATARDTYSLWDVATGRRIDAIATGVLSDRLKKIKETQSQIDFFHELFEEQAGGGSRHSYDYSRGLSESASSDGTLLVQGKLDGGIDIVQRKDMKVLSSLAGHETQILGIAISADNTLIASADETSVVIWERAGGRELARFSSLGGDTYCLDFSPDGTRLVSGDEDGVIRLWDTRSYKLAAELRGHGSYVHSVLFSPDGTQLVSASGDRTVRIWDTVSRGKRLKHARAAKGLREKMRPTVDRLLDEYGEPSDVAEILRGDSSLIEEERRAALRVLLARAQAGREGQ